MNKRKGMTLIEVVISIMILGMISISILPIAAHAMKFAKWNNIKLNALNLAYSQVEWLKTLNYEELGLNIKDYSPGGKVRPEGYMDQTEPVNIDGVQYNIYTGIYWEKATSSMGDVAQAMKKVDVTVEATDINTGVMKEYAVLGTLITREGERNFTNPNHIIANVYLRNSNNPVKNARVELVSSKGNIYTNTDEKGEAMFGNLDSGGYYIEPTKWKYNSLMLMPKGVDGINKKWKTNEEIIISEQDATESRNVYFMIDLPAYIKIRDINIYHEDIKGANFIIKPTSKSYTPPGDGENDEYNMELVTTITNINNTKFWRLWSYDYEIITKDGRTFYLEDIKSNKIWDGKFDMSNLNQESVVEINLRFGLEGGKLVRNSDGSVEITLDFSSNIENYEDISFAINNEEISKDEGLVTITKVNNNQITIIIDQTIGVDSGDIEFAITNYHSITNNYGMTLAHEKNSITINQ